MLENLPSPFHRGKVIAHSSMGRCKIFWEGVAPSEFNDENHPERLPDAEPAMPLFASGNDGDGVYFYPKIGTIVWGFFQNNDINMPVFFASTLLNRSRNEEHFSDINSNSAGENDEKIVKSGDVKIVLNSKDDSVKITAKCPGDEERHSTIRMDSNGDISIECSGNLKISAGSISVNANSGSADITAKNGINAIGLDRDVSIGAPHVLITGYQSGVELFDQAAFHGITTDDWMS